MLLCCESQLTKIKGTIPLKDYEECECAPEEKKPTFKLYSSNKEIRAFNIQAETEADAKAWAQAITTCIKVCPLKRAMPNWLEPAKGQAPHTDTPTAWTTQTPRFSRFNAHGLHAPMCSVLRRRPCLANCYRDTNPLHPTLPLNFAQHFILF